MTPAASHQMLCQIGITLLVVFAREVALSSPTSAWLTRTWQTEDGLPNTYVSSIAQGQDGFLWVAMPVTLARFDGVHFTKFPFRSVTESDYQGSRQNQGARKLVPSRNGGLWITPVRGPAVWLSPDQAKVTALETGLPPGTSPANSMEDAEGNYWIATSEAIERSKDGKTQQFGAAQGVPSGTVYSLTLDDAGNVWLAKGSNGGGTSIVVFKNERFVPVTFVRGLARLAAARTNGVWIANHKHLFKCDLNGRQQDFGPFQPDHPSTDVAAVLEDHSGAVWLGTDGNGLFRHSAAGSEAVETSYPKILSLAEDREGNLWVGTGGGGLDRVSPRGVHMEGMDSGFSLIGIQSICEDTQGVLWGATQNGLLVRRDNERWISPFTNAPGRVTCVAADGKGSLWIGTQDKSLHCWRDHRFFTWDGAKGLIGNSVVALLFSSKGDLWISEYTPNGVQCLHDGVLRSLSFPRDPGRIYAMTEDKAGNLWFGTATGLLLRADGDQLVDETSRASVSGRAIRSLYATADGALWIGYGGWGLGRIKDGRFAALGLEQGLPDDYLSQIISDGQGWLWFGSAEHGLFKLREQQLEQAFADPTTRLRPVLYGRNEGVSGMEVFGTTPGAMQSRDGRLWIPMRKALAVVDPKVLHENPEPPKVLLTQVVLDSQTIASYGGVTFTQRLANLKTLDAPLRLPPGHRRLEIDFTALNFMAPENVHFQHQLEGYDNDWVDAEPPRSASYSRLGSGTYKFRVRACNADGIWNEASSALGFIVAPFFWQTLWFRSIVLVGFTSLVIGVVRYISFRRLREELWALEQQAALDKERNRIARDLHDDLGCSLTHVALVLEMNESRRAGTTLSPPNGKPQLCSSMVRQVVKSVDEIIWAISPRNDELQYLIDYIVEFAVEFLQAAGIRPQVDLPEPIPERVVSPEVRHNLFLVVKECLNNIVRHARASEVRFRLMATDEQLGICIEDNGQGFQPAPESASPSADGLRNMRLRMEEIGGRFQIDSQSGAGTKVWLYYPWPRAHARARSVHLPYAN